MRHSIFDRQVVAELDRRFPKEIKKRRWAEIARELKVNRGDLWSVYHRRTRSNKIRKALGMPHFEVTAYPCECGEIHLKKRCKRGEQIVNRSRSKYPSALKAIQEVIVPFLREREARCESKTTHQT